MRGSVVQRLFRGGGWPSYHITRSKNYVNLRNSTMATYPLLVTLTPPICCFINTAPLTNNSPYCLTVLCLCTYLPCHGKRRILTKMADTINAALMPSPFLPSVHVRRGEPHTHSLLTSSLTQGKMMTIIQAISKTAKN